METSVLIARLFAVVYLFLGVGFLLNPKYYRKTFDELMKSAVFMFFGVFMASIAGILIVTYHNIWEYSWVVVITLFGWIALLKGFIFAVFPESTGFWRGMMKKDSFFYAYGVIILLLGLFFGYYGFLV